MIIRKKNMIILIFLLISYSGYSQIPDSLFSKEQEKLFNKIENIAENSENELDYNDLLENYKYYIENPINLNSDDVYELSNLLLLNDIHINNLTEYKNKNGKLLTIYELKAIEGFDNKTIERILPFVIISEIKTRDQINFKDIFKYGKNQFIIRFKQTLEKRQAYKNKEDSLLRNNSNKYYAGGSQYLYGRYGFNYRNKIRFGFTTEKDPGEVFFNDTLRNPFEFISAYLYLKDISKIKTFIVGDYHLEFGQGLTMWSGLAFGKSADAINIKKRFKEIRPNTSANENRFMRGAAATINIANFDITAFYSNKNIDGNIIIADTLPKDETFFSSFQETGYHRTLNEILDKNMISESIFGGRVSFRKNFFNIGATSFETRLGSELLNPNNIYNQFEFSGKQNLNFGLDYNVIIRNINLFGEVAGSKNGGKAWLIGGLFMPDPRVSLSLLYRNYQKDFQNLLSNAFGENNRNNNEKGLYFGISAQLTPKISAYAYTDQFSFPYLKYLVDAPSKGNEYLVQINYQLSALTQMYFRFREKNKPSNHSIDDKNLDFLTNENKRSFRYQIDYSISPSIVLKNRMEYVTFQNNTQNEIFHGYLVYQDVCYTPVNKPISFRLRFAIFDTDNYDSRIYAYENDVLYAFSVPALYSKGSRYYFLLKYRIINNIDIWFRIAQTFYSNKNTIGSGLDEIKGNTKTDVVFQLRWKF